MSEGRNTELVSWARAYKPYNHLNDGQLIRELADALESTSRALSEKEGECAKLKESRYRWTRRYFEAAESYLLATRQRDEALAALKASEERGSGEPVAWVIPGDDIAKDNGFIDAMAWQEGEFTRPLFDRPRNQENGNG